MSALEIIVNVSGDLPSYHDGNNAFGAHLALKADSKTSMLTLLKLEKWGFHAYRYNGADKVIRDNDIKVTTISAGRGDFEPQRILNWLAIGRDVHFNKDDEASPPGRAIDPSQANAVQILQGSITWPAPLPHVAQMAHLLRIELMNGAKFDESVLLLPITDAEYSGVEVGDNIVTIPAHVGPKNDIKVGVKAIKLRVKPDFPPPPAPIREDGFLTRSWSEPEFRFLRELESQAGSLVSTLPALLTLPHHELLKCEKAELCKLGCILAIDSLLFSLISNEKVDREGELLSPLMSLLTRENRRMATKELRAKIKEVVKELGEASKLAHVLFAPSAGTIPSNPNALELATSPADETTTLYHLLTIQKPQTPEEIKLIEGITSEQVLSALNHLMSRLQSESGLEPVFLRMIGWAIAKMGTDHKGLKDKFPEFVFLVQGPFNAANAVRVDCGVLLAEVVVNKKKDAATLWSVTKGLNLHSNRLETPAGFWDGLPNVSGLKPLVAQKDNLKQAWESLIARRLPEEIPDKSTLRFQPDNFPQPLPIPIATVPAGQDELNSLTRRFNGIAVLIRREEEKWAHANLVNLQTIWSKDSIQPDKPPVEDLKMRGVQPFLPVAVDGRREMFLQYNGTPLSSPAYSQTMAPSMQSVDTTGRLPFFTTRDADFNDNMLERPPRLAYGKKYEAIAYAVTKAGVLPKVLQADSEKSPWLPKTPEDGKGPPADQTIKSTYLRTTAIGSTTFGTPLGQPQRIGTAYPDVFPLALDHPRLNVTAFQEKEGILDLFRNTDGTGQLPLPSLGAPTLFDLEDCCFSPEVKDVTVIVEVHTAENAELLTTPHGVIELKDTDSKEPLKRSSLQFSIRAYKDKPDGSEFAIALVEDVAKLLWVRLRIQVNKDARNLSFSLPNQRLVTSHGTMPDSPPVLLVSPKERKWLPVFHNASIICSRSRTTWRDWDYWYSNPDLEMYGQNRKTIGITKQVDDALVAASVLRGVDPDIAKHIDRLPDPAVAGYLIELAAIDTITNTIKNPVPVKNVFLYSEVEKVKTAFENPPLDRDPHTFLRSLKTYLQRIDTAFQMTVGIKCQGNVLEIGNDGAITVPSGIVSQLTVRPLVKKPTISLAIDPRMQQLACATIKHNNTEYFVFEGASLTVESMHDAVWNENLPAQYRRTAVDKRYPPMLNNHVAVRTTPQLREYRITETAAVTLKEDLWKCFSHMDIRTQRWRFSGRPIYSWISPRSYLAEGMNNLGGPCLELKAGDLLRDKAKEIAPDLTTFESELYFDRDDADCEVTRVRLTGQMKTHGPEALGETLQSFAWELPSATYFRHGFQFVSRYSGALYSGGGGSPAWPPEGIPWVRRVAILADATRLELSRPQVRCLVPLSTTPSESELVFQGESDPLQSKKAPSPPVACILEEKPYAVGGLADRILAEITTGIGYGFEDKDQKSVLPLDFGKETSRDGRIASWSWMPHFGETTADPSKSFILNAEGPVGLHFERATTAAPNWVNCEYLLQPRSLDGQQVLPDESFVAVQMRRILSPDWVASRPDAVVITGMINVFQSALATFNKIDLAKEEKTSLMNLVAGDKTHSVLEYKFEKQVLVVYVARKWIAATDKLDGSLELCRITTNNSVKKVAVIHTQLSDGLFHATVCVIPDNANLMDGTIKSYTPLASVSWSRPKEVMATDLVFPKAIDVSIVSASSETTREWTRTAKNSSCVATLSPDKYSLDEPQWTKNLRAKITDGNLIFTSKKAGNDTSIWLTTETAESRMPLYLQRHLVAVFTTKSQSIGRQVDLFQQACLINGREPKIPVASGVIYSDVRLHEIEIPSVIIAYGKNKAFDPEDLLNEKPAGSLHRFTKGRIDTTSSGGNAGKRIFRFYFRLANSFVSVGKLRALTVKMAFQYRKEPGSQIKELPVLPNVAVPNDKRLRAFEIEIKGGDRKVTLLLHYWNDTSPQESSFLLPEEEMLPENIDGVDITISKVEGDIAELWADVSVLHSEIAHKSVDFDFNWLFSSISINATQSANRTLPAELASRTEAQARLIAFGDPILLK